MKDILQSFSSLVGVPVNLLLIGILAVVLAIVLTRLGKRTSAALVFAAYPAFLLLLSFPYQARLAEMIGRGNDLLLAAVVLAIFYLASYFVIVRFLSGRVALSGAGSFMEAVLIALALASLFFVASYHILGTSGLLSFMPFLETIAMSREFFFFGLAAPLAIFFFFIYE